MSVLRLLCKSAVRKQAMSETYSLQEEALLLKIARETLEAVTKDGVRPRLDVQALPEHLREERPCFVALYVGSELRGCTGTLAARRALADDVAITTIQTAFNDPRFAPVVASEVPHIRIEIS